MLCICVTELPNECSICGGCAVVFVLCAVFQTQMSLNDKHFGSCSLNEQHILRFHMTACSLNLSVFHILHVIYDFFSRK